MNVSKYSFSYYSWGMKWSILKTFSLVFFFGVFLFSVYSCKKDFTAATDLTFSKDTLTFDTLFTAPFSSVTKSFKVFNNSKQTMLIEDIRLMHLVGNQFKINVDGIPGDAFSNVEILPQDSIYIFVEVKVDDPNSGLTPFVIIDDVVFTLGGTQKTVHLQAWGQRAHFHYGDVIPAGTTTWTNDLPHVIVPKDTIPGVYVPVGSNLNIAAGCKIFVAANAGIFVEGTLNACATSWSDSIVFQGVRLESFYNNRPGQWFGLVFLRADDGVNQGDGSLCYCVLEESSYGIYAGGGTQNNPSFYQNTATRPNINIQNCIVRNNLYNGIFGFNANITATNSLFYAAGEHLIKLGLGGDYQFQSCTFFNNGSSFLNHQDETVLVSNFISDGNSNVYPAPLDNAQFKNCVVSGNLENEVSFNKVSAVAFNSSFEYCLIKNKQDTVSAYSTVTNSLFNLDPRFEKPDQANFMPSDSAGYFSPLIDAAPTGPISDLFNVSRPISKTSNANKFDIGAIEAP